MKLKRKLARMNGAEAEVRAKFTQLRVERGFSQRTVGDLVEWSQGTVSKYEHGEQAITVDVLAVWARHYGVTAGWLFGEAVDQNQDGEWVRLRNAFVKLGPSMRRALLVMVEGQLPDAKRVVAGRPIRRAQRSTPAKLPDEPT